MTGLGSKFSTKVLLTLAVVAIFVTYAVGVAGFYKWIGFDLAMNTMIMSGMTAALATLAYILVSLAEFGRRISSM